MKRYTCKICGHVWQSANPALECARFGCGSRLVIEDSAAAYGGGMFAPAPPFTNTTAAPSGALGARVFLWIAAVFFILAAFVSLLAAVPWVTAGAGGFLASRVLGLGAFVLSGAFVGMGSLFNLVGYILCLVNVHRAWKAVQPAPGQGRGLNVPTPGEAIGFLFIPFFGLYWVFIAFGGLMKAANALRAERQIPGAPFSGNAATAFGVCTLLSAPAGFLYFATPPLFLTFAIANCFLLARIASDAARIANTITQEESQYDHYMRRL